jgi:hypothetical protein
MSYELILSSECGADRYKERPSGSKNQPVPKHFTPYFSIEQHIRLLFATPAFAAQMTYGWEQMHADRQDKVCDIYDGQFFRQHIMPKMKQYDQLVSLAADGLPLSSMGAQSCYTLIATFDSLPPWIRNHQSTLLAVAIVAKKFLKMIQKFIG